MHDNRHKDVSVKKEEIHLWDIKRILLGQAPPEFLPEVFIRTLLVYVAAIVVMRWMGNRMNGQQTIVELSVMVMMGAIISVPMQVPDRGILQGLLVLLATLFLLRNINWLGFKNTKFEKTVQGEVVLLVKVCCRRANWQKQKSPTSSSSKPCEAKKYSTWAVSILCRNFFKGSRAGYCEIRSQR